MKHPPYHLRLNKAIDRFLMIDALRILRKRFDLGNYTYYGFGGPFLEDFKLIREYCPEIKMVSIEKDYQTYLRQRFHQFCSNIKLKNTSFERFISNYTSTSNEVFWLDYTDVKPARLEEFMQVIGLVSEYSVIKITVRCQLDYDNPFARQQKYNIPEEIIKKDKEQYLQDFEQKYGRYLMSQPSDAWFTLQHEYTNTICSMLQVQAERSLPANANGNIFQLISLCWYNDQTAMLSATGIVCPISELENIKALFREWDYVQFKWENPHRIDVPILSIKERLRLEHQLPACESDCKKLAKTLNYLVDENAKRSLEKIQQYAEFHKYYPYFAKVNA